MEQFTSFSASERARLDRLIEGKRETYAPGQDIIAVGEKVDEIHLVLSGL